MKQRIQAFFLLAVSDLFLLSACLSQQDTTIQQSTRLTLSDGSELIGTVLAEDSLSITFKTHSDILMTIPRDRVKMRESLAGQMVGGEYVRPDPNHTRLFFAPTARPLKSRQGYFSAYQIFFPFLAVGVTDFITLAGGISLVPGAESQILYLAPKVTPVNLHNFSVSGGVLYINSTSGGSEGVGIIYGVTSYGSQNASVTAGLGWGFHGEETADKPVLMLGGDVRISNSVKLISENWFPPNSDIAVVSFGIRFFGENLAADLGFIHLAGAEMSGFPFIPWLGFAYNFGSAK